MNQTHFVTGTLNAADRDAVLAAMQTIKDRLPFLMALSTADRQALPKAGAKGRVFIAQALEVARQNPGILPRSFDIEEFACDAELIESLLPITIALGQLAELIADTQVAVETDAYTAALMVYQQAKLAGKSIALETNLDGLAARFARKSKTVTPTPAPAPTPKT